MHYGPDRKPLLPPGQDWPAEPLPMIWETLRTDWTVQQEKEQTSRAGKCYGCGRDYRALVQVAVSFPTDPLRDHWKSLEAATRFCREWHIYLHKYRLAPRMAGHYASLPPPPSMPLLAPDEHGHCDWERDRHNVARWVGPMWNAAHQTYTWHDSWHLQDSSRDRVYTFNAATKAWECGAHPNPTGINLLAAVTFSYPALDSDDASTRRSKLMTRLADVCHNPPLKGACERDYRIYKSLFEQALHHGELPTGWIPRVCYLKWRPINNGFRQIAVVNAALDARQGYDCWIPSENRFIHAYTLIDANGWQVWQV